MIDERNRQLTAIIATVGWKEVFEDGEIRYYCGTTDEGWCFKDKKAYDTRSVCYIPEVDFRGHDYLIEGAATGYTREDIEKILRETLEELELPFSEDFVVQKARSVFDVAEWESIGVVVDRIDWEEELNEFNMKEN